MTGELPERLGGGYPTVRAVNLPDQAAFGADRVGSVEGVSLQWHSGVCCGGPLLGTQGMPVIPTDGFCRKERPGIHLPAKQCGTPTQADGVNQRPMDDSRWSAPPCEIKALRRTLESCDDPKPQLAGSVSAARQMELCVRCVVTNNSVNVRTSVVKRVLVEDGNDNARTA